jgi:hypothetical protein
MTHEDLDKKAKALGAVKHVKVEDYNFYFKKAHRHVIGLAMAKINVNPVEANEILLNNTIIAEVSDMEALKDDSIFFALVSEMDDIISVKKSTSRTL